MVDHDLTVRPPAPIFPAARSFLDSLTVTRPQGGLCAGTPVTLPAAFNPATLILGLRGHPTSKMLYARLVALGVDSSGG